MNLYLTNRNVPNITDDHETIGYGGYANWQAIKEVSNEEGTIILCDTDVTTIAKMLKGVVLSDGKIIRAYPHEDGSYGSSVLDFGPALLPEKEQAAIRELLSYTRKATALWDLLIERRLQVSFHGRDSDSHDEARMEADNESDHRVVVDVWHRDMIKMLRQLGVVPADYLVPMPSGWDRVTFELFESRVQLMAEKVCDPDMVTLLNKFIEYGKLNDATHVFWS